MDIEEEIRIGEEEMDIEERKQETRIIALNANGFPSNKANRHKLK